LKKWELGSGDASTILMGWWTVLFCGNGQNPDVMFKIEVEEERF
jgi:hypothetical protein